MNGGNSRLARMIDEQIRHRGIHDQRVLDAMLSVDRKHFVPEQYHRNAYSDGPLPLVCEQTISQPYIVALMTQLLETTPDCHCLEIGSGSGYQTAILARLCATVISIEIIPELHQMAARNLKPYAFDNLVLIQDDGRKGFPGEPPFDRIMVTAAPLSLPGTLGEQLKEGGIMVIPIGDRSGQVLYRIRKQAGRLEQEPVCGVLFVPLT